MWKLTVAILALAGGVSASKDFDDYCRQYGKQYSGSIYKMREARFETAVAEMHRHSGTSSYRKGLNHMSDWTEAEFKAINGYHRVSRRRFLKMLLFVWLFVVVCCNWSGYQNLLRLVFTSFVFSTCCCIAHWLQDDRGRSQEGF